MLIYNGFESAAEIQVGAPLLIPIDLTQTNTFRVDEFYLQLGAYSDQRKAEEASNQAVTNTKASCWAIDSASYPQKRMTSVSSSV